MALDDIKANEMGRSPMTPTNEELQRVANYRLVTKTLRSDGIGSIVFGVIAIGMGLSGMKDNPLNIYLALIGCFLTLEGIWLVSAPVPIGMIVDGIALLILGIWNILVAISNTSTGSLSGHGLFAYLGLWQIVWGFKKFGRYTRFREMPQTKPTPESIHRIDEIVNEITKSKMADDPNLIVFRIPATTFFDGPQVWKARLVGANAVFTEKSGCDCIIAKKDDVDFVKTGKFLIGKTLKADFRIQDRNLKGQISPKAFERYERWKTASQPA